MLKEFKKFISRGNVIDLAVGVVIGASFGKIVTSLVEDILMPIIGVISGGLDFSNLTISIKDATIKYGNFIQNTVDFFIVAFCIFIFVKSLNKLLHKKEAEKQQPAKHPHPSDEVKLLMDIKKELVKQNKKSK